MNGLNSECCTRQLDSEGSVIKFSMSTAKLMRIPAVVIPCCSIQNFCMKGLHFAGPSRFLLLQAVF